MERRIECDETKNPRREESETPTTSEQCKRNPMKAFEEVEMDERIRSSVEEVRYDRTVL